MMTVESEHSAIVIGAGLGGLAAAMRLGAKGWRVTVLDRLDRPGGRGSSVSIGGYRFDLGPTIVTMPSVLEDLWAAVGRDFHKDVELRPMDPFYEIRWQDGSRFRAVGDTDTMLAEVNRLSPRDVSGYLNFLAGAAERYEVGFQRLGRIALHDWRETAKVIPTFARLRADRSILAYVRRHVRDPRLRMALSFHPLFIGGNPARVTSIYALVSHLEKEFGVHYAMGGVQAIADAMVRVIRSQGGSVQFGVTVDEITTKDRRVTGVRVGGDHLGARVVVSNADAGHTYDVLLKTRKRRWSRTKLRRQRWSMGLFVWYFGTRRTSNRWRDIGHHTIINGPRYEGLLREIFLRGRLSEDMSLYLHRPSVTDPSVAPEGDDTFYALSPVPHLGWNSVNWETEADAYRQKVAKVLESHIPGFQAHIAASHVMTPIDFRDLYLSPHGCGFSIEPRILQSAWFRPHNVSEEVEGLYLAGAGTHPGAGLPGVISSAEVAANLVPDAPRAIATRVVA